MSDWFDDAVEELIEDEARAEAEAEMVSWDPEEGEILKAVFLKAVPVKTKYGAAYSVFVKPVEGDNKDETIKVFCSRSVLVNELCDAMPKPGKLVVFRYLGRKDSKGGRRYHAYQVRGEVMDTEYWTPLIRKAAEFEAQPSSQAAAPVSAADVNPFE